MILSQTAMYALRATLYLAEHSDDQPVRVDDIAAALDVPRNYLSKILHSLARGGLLHSARGPGGGFSLAKPPGDTALIEVVAHFDDLDDARCLLGRPECRDDDPCAAHGQWKQVAAAVHAFFRNTTVAEIARRAADSPETRRLHDLEAEQ